MMMSENTGNTPEQNSGNTPEQNYSMLWAIIVMLIMAYIYK